MKISKLTALVTLLILLGGLLGAGALTAAADGQAGTTLTAYKTAAGHWERTFHWRIDKQAAPEVLDLGCNQSGTVRYTVSVEKDAGTDQYMVAGQICVTNGGSIPTAGLTIWDDVLYKTGAGPYQVLLSVQVDTSAMPVLNPGDSYCYPYTVVFTPVAGALYKNSARVTITNHSGHLGEPFGPSPDAGFSLPGSPDVIINDTVHVDDTNGGSWEFSASGSVSYDQSFTCPRDGGTHTNRATIRETGAWDEATVTVNCHGPCACTLTPGYWKTHSRYGPAPYDDTWALVGENTPFFLSGKSWYQVLWTPPAGNAYYILSFQYVAAKLNILNGAASTPAVDAALAWAENFFNTYTPASSLSKSLRAQVISYAGVLADYNSGLTGPGHCSE